MNIKIPVSWLREYLKTDVAAKTIAQYLTASGPSVERIQKHGEDLIFDTEVTSNRPDALSIFGIAREANAILIANNQKSQLLTVEGINQSLEPDTQKTIPLDVIVQSRSLCPRFAAIIVDNVKIGPSPAIIKNRLAACGIRTINNIVDISNYVMIELGQPMHTFDYDKIKGAKMTLRESKEGERIKTIDGQTRKLPKGTIVIEDTERLIDLCGIMGGANSEISSRTKRVVIFVQAYDPIRIRKTTQALAFRTEAATRFEKGIDLEGIIPALKKAAYLAKKTAGAKIASELIDIYKKEHIAKPITLNLQKLASYLGIDIKPQKAAQILDLLGFDVKTTSQTLTATPPSFRTNDMETQEDLIEEIARIYGYHNLPSKLPSGQIPKDEENALLQKVIELKKALKYLGLTEVMTYSIISKEFLLQTGLQESEAVELTNPLSSEWQFMRPTLIVSLASVIAQNQNLKDNLKIFEVAKTYEKKQKDIPQQDLKIGIILQNSSFYDIKGLVENLFEIIKKEPRFEKFSGKNPLSENSMFSLVKIGTQTIGGMGILKREVAQNLGIEGDAFIAEINLTACFLQPSTQLSYQPIPKFPPVIEDISAIFEEKVEIAQIIAQTKRAGEPLVKNIEIIDIFRGEKIGRGKKSITLRLTYQEVHKTPDQEDVTKFRRIISDHLESYLKAQIRK